MALPTPNEQQTLEFTALGLPFLNITGKNTVIADGLEFTALGLGYFATSPSAEPSTYNAAQFFMLF
jgi:hypothetical protein